MKIEFIGLLGADVCRHVLDDAIRRRNVNAIVAGHDGELIGWTLAIVDSREYWKKFLLRHPLISLRFASKRIARRHSQYNASSASEFKPVDWNIRTNRPWGVSSPVSARHLNITVLEPYRRQGVASMLQSAQIEDLRQQGVGWIDAYIEQSNEASISLYQKNGWAFAGEESGMLLVSLKI